MKKILFTRKLIKTSEDYASQLFKVKFNIDDELLTKEEIITQSNDCDGIISTVTEVFDNDIISKLSKRIVIISNFGVGFNNIDIKAAKKRNIIVTNTPDVLTEATAEIAILIILGAARRATEGIKYARNKFYGPILRASFALEVSAGRRPCPARSNMLKNRGKTKF